jgi:hypothetical protein
MIPLITGYNNVKKGVFGGEKEGRAVELIYEQTSG